MKTLGGVFPPIVTLFNQNGDIDLEANKKQADFLVEHGVDGIGYFGTTGEFFSVSLEEKKAFLRQIVPYVQGRTKVVVGIGDTCLKHTLELLALAEELGVDGVLSICPYYAVYEEHMVEAYYDAVANATKLPIILYNFPSLTGFCLMPEMVKRLVKRHANILGIKETIADPSHVKSMMGVKEVNPDFAVFGAFEDQGLGLAALHIDGYIDATANFAPEFTVGLLKAMNENDWAKAAECHRGMCEAMELYSYASPIFIGVKEGVYQRVFAGKQFGERLPALPLTQEGKDQVRAKLQALKLI